MPVTEKAIQKEVNCGVIRLGDDGIMYMYMREGYTVEVEDLKELVKITGELGGGKKYPNLIKGGIYTSISSEARAYSATTESNLFTLADAFVIRSMAQKLLANFYLKFDKPVSPTRFFDAEKEAIAWLKTFLPGSEK
jgi:hypothetical protein